jgi:hypothetical protein
MFWFLKKSIPKELLGCKKEPKDERDYKLREIMSSVPSFDWNKGYDIEEELGERIIIKNQGRSSSCVGMGWSYYAGVLEALENKKYKDFSARWIYSQIYLSSGGAYVRDGGQILTNQGIVPSALFPDKQTEEEMRRRDDVTLDLYSVAKVYLKTSYLDISDFYNIDTFASIVQQYKGFVGGVYDGFDVSWRTAFPKPSGDANMGHCLYFGKAKMINGKKYLGVCNSWGEEIGDRGWQWLGEEWFTAKRILYPKIIIDLPDEIERPKEKPRHYFTKDLRYGMQDKEVEWLQRCLAFEGLFVYPTFTDYFGGYTLRAVRAFQVKWGIPEMGVVEAQTRAKLNELYK